MKGTIIKNISNDYTVKCNNTEYICKARGKFRNNKETPLVGDNVEFDEKNLYILKILPRKNELIRPSIANIDCAIIVTSTKKPDFDSNLLDKLLTIISYNNITPIIYLTKIDLLDENELKIIKTYQNYYQKIGYQIIDNIKDLKNIIHHKTIVLTGQTGAGKSTLLNKLNPNLKIKTSEISDALGRGKHTTRHTEFYQIEDFYIADTPGFSKIDFNEMTSLDIRDNMIEIYEATSKCKYQDCLHIKEDNCEVKNQVNNNKILLSRYENYLNFIESLGGKK